MNERDRALILRRLAARLAADAAIVAVASVMAFGLVKQILQIYLRPGEAYEPIYMTYVIYPVGLAAGLVSWRRLRGLKRRLGSGAAGKGRVRRSRLAGETALVAAACLAASGLVEYASRAAAGAQARYALAEAVGLAVPTAALSGLVALLRFRSSRRSAARWVLDTRRRRGGGQSRRRAAFGSRGRPDSLRALRNSRVVESVVVVLGSVMAFGLVEFTANIVMGRDPDYQPVDMVGMILPMALVVGLISYSSLKLLSRSLLQLLRGIEKVASGDFSIELEGARAGQYRGLFEDFNAMCRELRSIQTLRDDFTNQFSHEFKTPIASINGFARILLDEELPEAERRQYLEIIASESERLAEMSTNAIAMVKLDSQQYVTDKAPYPLDEQLRQCAILLQPLWGKKRLELGAELESAAFAGNADLMKQVWINLLGNAIKFTPEGGKIELSLKREGSWLAVRISDSGIGMTEEELARAFDKYYQAGSAKGAAGPSHAAAGLGLGLAIVKRIVELCGGSVEARSVPGEGSEFTVRLPA